MFMFKKTLAMPSAAEALPGRTTPIPTAREHFILHRPLKGPYPEGLEQAMFGMGCFWGAERRFWELGKGIHITAVGYAAGHTPNPTYEEVCTGRTGHNEVVLVVYGPKQISYARLLGRAVEHECAPLHGKPRTLAGGYRNGRAHPTAH